MNNMFNLNIFDLASRFKQACVGQLLSGLGQVNYLVVQLITLIVNQYGTRLFKIDDEIVKSNECQDDRDNFYLHPIKLQQIEQVVDLNTITVEEGVIDGLVLSIPWKAPWSDLTIITIDQVMMVLSMKKHIESLYHSAHEHMNPFLKSDVGAFSEGVSDGGQSLLHQDLVSVYNEIKTLLFQYFEKIEVRITTIKVNVRDHMEIMIEGLIANSSTIHIDKITIYRNDHVYLIVNLIDYDIETKSVVISDIKIDIELVNVLPVFYLSDGKSTLELNVNIRDLTFADAKLEGLQLKMIPGLMTVDTINKITIDNTLLMYFDTTVDSNILQVDLAKKTVQLHKQINCKLTNIDGLQQWLMKMKTVATIAGRKIVYHRDPNSRSESDDPNLESNAFKVINIKMVVVINDNIFKIRVNRINLLTNGIRLNDIMLVFDDTELTIKNIIVGDLVILKDTIIRNLKSENKSSESNMFTYDKDDYFKMKADFLTLNHQSNSIKMELTDMVLVNPIELMNVATNIIKIVLPKNNEDNKIVRDQPFTADLVLKRGQIILKQFNLTLDARIHEVYINIIDEYVSNLVSDILCDGYLIMRMNADYLDKSTVTIKQLHCFLDPNMFDLLNMTIGTLKEDKNEDADDIALKTLSEDELNLLMDAMGKTVVASNMSDFNEIVNSSIQDSFNEKMSNSILHQLQQSIGNLRKSLYIVDDHMDHLDRSSAFQPIIKTVELSLKIDIINIYLFDKLSLYDVTVPLTGSLQMDYPSFACIILKKIVAEQEHTNDETKYTLTVNNGAMIDCETRNSKWKYFLKKDSDGRLFNAQITTKLVHNKMSLRINLQLSPISLNIREEILIRVLAFFSNSYELVEQPAEPIFIEIFSINDIKMHMNYYPLLLKQLSPKPDMFTIHNYQTILPHQYLTNIRGFGELGDLVSASWKKVFDPSNVMSFAPNIKLIQPYTSSINRFYQLTTTYFRTPTNKRRIRNVTSGLGKGISLMNNLVKHGANSIFDLIM